jgi:hypothetical protein
MNVLSFLLNSGREQDSEDSDLDAQLYKLRRTSENFLPLQDFTHKNVADELTAIEYALGQSIVMEAKPSHIRIRVPLLPKTKMVPMFRASN